METILELRGVTKRFGSLTANRDIDLTIKKGTIHAIVGENGAGKSTLMNIISGIHRMDAGAMYFEGKPVNFRSPTEASKAGIGMVHQELCCFRSFLFWTTLSWGMSGRTRWAC